jgi:hydrogenase/urease accessory protein HupE
MHNPERLSCCPNGAILYPPFTSFLSVTFFVIVIALVSAVAHPVTQGAMNMRIHPGRLEIVVRVSTEEVFVASSFSPNANTSDSLADVWKAHGEYLLNHLRFRADRQPLLGRVTAVEPPGSSLSSSGYARPGDFVSYYLSYSSARENEYPREIRIEEDVLKEFSYAPGNPWTSSFVVTVEQPERSAPVGGLLLDRNQPLTFRCTTASLGSSEIRPGRDPSVNAWGVFRDYVVHGLLHIFTGYDHMLFMSALALAALTIWDLVKVVSAFTVAHSVTLTLSVLNVVRLPEHVVEPMIAASIVFVALQNAFIPKRSRGWTRLWTAFFFGLFHGLGFAGGLLDAMAGLPIAAIGVAILAFSVGVELAQQSVVLPTFFLLKLLGREEIKHRSAEGLRLLVQRYGSLLICALGTFYLVESLR